MKGLTMGLFSASVKKCHLCGSEFKGASFVAAGGTVCSDCYYKISMQNPDSLNTGRALIEHLKYREANHTRLESITPTFSIEIDDFALYADDKSRLFYWLNKNQLQSLKDLGFYKNVPEPEVFSYDEVVSYGYFENDSQIQGKSGLGRAVVGGVLLGGVGAIVGGMTGSKTTDSVISSMAVTIALDNPYRTSFEFILISKGQVRYGSGDYVKAKNDADKIMAFFDHISGNEDTVKSDKIASSDSSSSISPSTEIMKLKGMLDQGIITDDEFVAMKQKLISQL